MTAPLSGGREDEGGGRSSAPLVPHPASQIFPPMTDDEFTALCGDIAERGQLDDILLLDGQILEGNNRYRACMEVGVEPRTIDWIGSDPVAFVLSKNLHRRHLSLPQKAAVAVEAESIYEAAAHGRHSANRPELGANLPQAEKGRALDHAVQSLGVSRRSAQDAKRVKENSAEAFADMKSGKLKSVRSALKAIGVGKDGGSSIRHSTKKAPVKKEVPEHVASQARIRASDAESKYRSMLNAPEGKLNIPLLDRASKIQDILLELTGLTPEKAVSGIPSVRCREYSLEMAQWWLRFAELCDERRRTETPDLPPLYKRPRLATLNPVVGPVAPAVMSPTTRAVYDWTMKQDEPVTVIEAAVAAHINRSTAGDCLRNLVRSGHLEVVGTAGTGANAFNLYQAAKKDPDDPPEGIRPTGQTPTEGSA